MAHLSFAYHSRTSTSNSIGGSKRGREVEKLKRGVVVGSPFKSVDAAAKDAGKPAACFSYFIRKEREIKGFTYRYKIC